MPVYEYKALDMKGKTVSGMIDTESIGLARQKLRASKIFPTEIKELYAAASQKENRAFSIGGFFTRVSRSEMTMITRQLSTLVGAGFPLVSALATLIPQSKSQIFRKVLSQIKDSIEGGNSFAGALSLYPDTFTPIYINMVRAGESSGTLEIVLERLADIAEKQQTLSNKIKSVLAYPAVMTVVAAAVLFFLLAYIVPRITSIFADIHQVLPTPTRVLLGISDVLKTYWWLFLLLVVGAAVVIRIMRKNEKGRRILDRFLLSLPITGPLFRKLAVARFARTLGSLLENGVSMLVALDIVKNIVGNVIIAETVEMAAREVEKGHGLGKTLDSANTFPHLAVQMIQVGEQSGALESMLNKVADVFEKEVEASMVALTSLLEPLIILIMGVVVAFIVLSIILPIIKMNQLIK